MPLPMVGVNNSKFQTASERDNIQLVIMGPTKQYFIAVHGVPGSFCLYGRHQATVRHIAKYQIGQDPKPLPQLDRA